MKVVNLRHSDYDVYIGRRGHGHDGYFGNPIVPGKTCPVCGEVHSRGNTLKCYREYLEVRLEQDPDFRERVKALRGKVLGCFCKPRPCHGDVLLEFVDKVAVDEEYSCLF